MTSKKRGIWTQTCTEERQCDNTEREDSHVTTVMHPQAKEHQGLLAENTRRGKRQRMILTRAVTDKMAMSMPRFQTSSLQNCDKSLLF